MTETKTPKIKKYDYRCPVCGRLAFRAYLGEYTKIYHRCAKCGQMLTFISNGRAVSIILDEEENGK